MKKRIASWMLLVVMTATTVGVAMAAVHNPKNEARCLDRNGKFIESKDCDPANCGCFFHQIEEYIRGFFK